MTAELYDRLTGGGTQTAHAIETMGEADVDVLIAGLNILIAAEAQDDG